jgi:hypothetical protein
LLEHASWLLPEATRAVEREDESLLQAPSIDCSPGLYIILIIRTCLGNIGKWLVRVLAITSALQPAAGLFHPTRRIMARRKTRRTAALYDLSGEIPVTWPEIDAWCIAVAGIKPDSWRRDYYVAHWGVFEKIRAAKVAGTFEKTINHRDRPKGAF